MLEQRVRTLSLEAVAALALAASTVCIAPTGATASAHHQAADGVLTGHLQDVSDLSRAAWFRVQAGRQHVKPLTSAAFALALTGSEGTRLLGHDLASRLGAAVRHDESQLFAVIGDDLPLRFWDDGKGKTLLIGGVLVPPLANTDTSRIRAAERQRKALEHALKCAAGVASAGGLKGVRRLGVLVVYGTRNYLANPERSADAETLTIFSPVPELEAFATGANSRESLLSDSKLFFAEHGASGRVWPLERTTRQPVNGDMGSTGARSR